MAAVTIVVCRDATTRAAAVAHRAAGV